MTLERAYSDEAEGKNASNNEFEQFDLSFAYSFKWDRPEHQIREALKVLLCNKEGEEIPEMEKEAALAKQEKRDLAKAHVALEAARIRWLLAINPNTPPPVLDHLSREAPPSLLERIAEHPRSHSTTLSRLANHENPQVRAAVAENINASLKTIWKLVRDPSPDVRLRLAESYTVPLATLRVLAEDENPYVANRAQLTMLRLMKELTELRTA